MILTYQGKKKRYIFTALFLSQYYLFSSIAGKYFTLMISVLYIPSQSTILKLLMAGTTSEWVFPPPGRWELLLQSKMRMTKAQYLVTMACNPFARPNTGKRSEQSWKWKRDIVLHRLLEKPQIQKQKASKNPFIFSPLPTRMSFLHHTYKFNKEMGSGISFHISASCV